MNTNICMHVCVASANENPIQSSTTLLCCSAAAAAVYARQAADWIVLASNNKNMPIWWYHNKCVNLKIFFIKFLKISTNRCRYTYSIYIILVCGAAGSVVGQHLLRMHQQLRWRRPNAQWAIFQQRNIEKINDKKCFNKFEIIKCWAIS